MAKSKRTKAQRAKARRKEEKNMKNLQKSFFKLQKVRQDTGQAFSKMDDTLIEKFLGEHGNPRVHQSLKEYGDGHILYGIPASFETLLSQDALVLFSMNSPLLNGNTDFNPTRKIETLPFWRKKGLTAKVHSTTSNQRYNLRFMSWQQKDVVHGITTPDAKERHDFLIRNRPDLNYIFRQEKDAATNFLNLYIDWLAKNEKPIILVINSQIRIIDNLEETMRSLWHDPRIHSIQAKVFGKNMNMMAHIQNELP